MVIRVSFDEDFCSTGMTREVYIHVRDDSDPNSIHSTSIGNGRNIVAFVDNDEKISSMKIWFDEGELSHRASRALRSLRNLESCEYKILDENERKFLRDLGSDDIKKYTTDYKRIYKSKILKKRQILTDELSLIDSAMEKLECIKD
jgi:hypothetical protein